jgi:hypothetical protein
MKSRLLPPVAHVSRRQFLAAGSAVWLASAAASRSPQQLQAQSAQSAPAAARRPLRVAAINSIFRLRSHAYHILGRMVYGFQKDGLHHQPNLQVVRMYNDQSPQDDLGPAFCRQQGIELAKTPSEALGGANGLDVDAVALIIEHGDYPANEFGQILYPRYELFQSIVEVFQKSRRAVPVFCDKHLSFDHQRAARMVATSKSIGFGLMAGSSLPVTWRTPQLELPLETAVEEGVVAFGYDRSLAEIYLFHALESLQCMLERRRGGETGVKSVLALRGDAVWKACDDGRISWPLVVEAVGRSPSANVGPIRDNVLNPLAILIEYADGTRGAVLNLIEAVSDFCFAARLQGKREPVSCNFDLPAPPGARFFDPLTWHIEQFFHSGRPPYPIERTLLTSTVLDLGLHSLHDGGQPIRSPALGITYQPPASSGFFRGPVADRH